MLSGSAPLHLTRWLQASRGPAITTHANNPTLQNKTNSELHPPSPQGITHKNSSKLLANSTYSGMIYLTTICRSSHTSIWVINVEVRTQPSLFMLSNRRTEQLGTQFKVPNVLLGGCLNMVTWCKFSIQLLSRQGQRTCEDRHFSQALGQQENLITREYPQRFSFLLQLEGKHNK